MRVDFHVKMKTIKVLLMLTLLTCLAATAFCGNDDDPKNGRAYIGKRFAVILAEQLGGKTDNLSEDTRLKEELNADWLDLAELCMAVEEDFDIEISDAQWAGVTTIKSAVDLIFDMKNSRGW